MLHAKAHLTSLVTTALLPVVVATAFCHSATAQLIAADSFNASDYEDSLFPGDLPLTDSGPNGDGRPVVVPGWQDDGSGSPARWIQGTANLRWDTDPTNATLGNGVVGYDDGSTGKATMLGVGDAFAAYRAGFRVMDDYAPASTYYMSALINPASAFAAGIANRDHAMIGFTNFWDEAAFENQPSATVTPFGLMFGFHGETADSNPAATDQIDIVIRARQADLADPRLVDTVLLAGTTESPLSNRTFLVMLKLEVNIDDGAFDRVTYWVNPGDVSSEAAATASTTATGTFNTLAMDQNDRIDRFSMQHNDWGGRGFFFDEIRFAYDFESLRGELPTSGLDGDYNNDGMVNLADYTVWRDALGASITLPNESATPGLVDVDDYDAWKANFGAEAMAASAASNVPEPAALSLACLSLVSIAALKHRRRGPLHIN